MEKVETVVKVRTPSDTGSVPYQAMDVQDELQILSDLKGQMAEHADKWIYVFNDFEGREIVGLSWTGTKEARWWFAQKGLAVLSDLETPPVISEVEIDGQRYVDATTAAKDLKTGAIQWATVRQPYVGKRKNGPTYQIDVSFVPRMALAKAQRNALQKLMPASFMADFISLARKSGNAQTLRPDKSQFALNPDEAKEIIDWLSKIEAIGNKEELMVVEEEITKLVGKLEGKLIYKLRQALGQKKLALVKENRNGTN